MRTAAVNQSRSPAFSARSNSRPRPTQIGDATPFTARPFREKNPPPALHY